jgi:subtilase family serine protease
MSRRSMSGAPSVELLTILLVCFTPMLAGSQVTKHPLITQPIDEQNLVVVGSTRPEVSAKNDRGPVADNLMLDHMYLQLKRAPEQDEAVKLLIDRLHDPKAAEYHRWLTAAEIAERFGPADDDLNVITAWLESHGFRVNVVYRPNGVIDFSGPASAIREAFHAEIHNLSVNGKAHIANVSNPEIPAALAPAVLGVVSINDFHPNPAFRPRAQYTFTQDGSTYFAVVPGDLHTIYNFNPVYANGVSGLGQTIVAVEDSNVYDPQNWKTFRDKFGLSQSFPHGSFQQIHPQPSNNPNNGGPCADPGLNVNGDEIEAILDAEWASASAPDAAIVLATCADTNTNFGGFIAMQNMLTGPGRPPGIFSISYGQPEDVMGGFANAPSNAYVNQLYEIAVLQGVSVFVAAGDGGAALTDNFDAVAFNGVAVNGLASTPNNVAVGGTDFGDTYLNENSTYWSSANGKYFDSALSYVPEVPWNDSCAGLLVNQYLGFPAPYGSTSFCNNSAFGQEYFLVVEGGSGGPSGCASGVPSIYGADPDLFFGFYAVVSGTCKGYPKPLYQNFVFGNPRDAVRDLPDVSLFAATGTWFHFYIVCDSDPADGFSCTGAPSGWFGAGGTSFASPIMAGIQAMIDQTTGSYQGNPNYVLYALGSLEYDLGGEAPCNSTLGNRANPNCIFYDVTLGDMVMPCQPLVVEGVTIGTFNCYLPSGTYGVMSLSNTSYEPAYPAAPGWDFATGLGSVNAYNLLRAWPGSRVQ